MYFKNCHSENFSQIHHHYRWVFSFWILTQNPGSWSWKTLSMAWSYNCCWNWTLFCWIPGFFVELMILGFSATCKVCPFVVVVGGRGGWGLGVWCFLWLQLWSFVQIFRWNNFLNKREPVPDQQHFTKTVRPEPCGETPYDPVEILVSFVC